MDSFHYRDGSLYCEEVRVDDLAEKFGTPCYVYSKRTLAKHFEELKKAFAPLDPLICYAVKTCSNIHILKVLAELGSGADVVSGGELYRALAGGMSPEGIVFAGVGKSKDELRQAIKSGIHRINVESAQELQAISDVATELGTEVSAAIRVNPDVVAGHKTPKKTTTGTKGNKFGIDIERVIALFNRCDKEMPFVNLDGLHFHLGSPIYDPSPYSDALTKILTLVNELDGLGHTIRSINIGGGFAADYETGTAPGWSAYADVIVPKLKDFVASGGKVVIEPGRSIAANAGVLLTQVRYIKLAGDRNMAIVDSGMSHLIRYAFYDSFHFIWPTQPRNGHIPEGRSATMEAEGLQAYDIAGPICESSDFFAHGRLLPELRPSDLLCVFSAGAYGMAMASHYNSIPRPPEVLIDGDKAIEIRRRETYEDLVGPRTSTDLSNDA